MNLNPCLKMTYEEKCSPDSPKNKPNSNPIKPSQTQSVQSKLDAGAGGGAFVEGVLDVLHFGDKVGQGD